MSIIQWLTGRPHNCEPKDSVQIKRWRKPRTKKKKIISIPNFPNYTQAVERIIKIATDAPEKVVGEEVKNGHVRAIIEGRKKLSKFQSKKDDKIQSPTMAGWLRLGGAEREVQPSPR